MSDEAPRCHDPAPEPAAAEARDLAAALRDEAAERRDAAAGERALQADQRDVVASEGDDEDLLGTDPDELRALCLELRRSAGAERQRASADRRAEAEDRIAAAWDRRGAAQDRRASAADRDEASLDPLTKAYNRAAGRTELGRDITRARRAGTSFVLAFLDVDGLKRVNDALGHAAGDRALVRVVQQLRAHLRPHDLVIRFGGDEFLCGMASMDDPELRNRLEHVSRGLASTAEPVSVTIGLSTLRPDDEVDDLIRRADAALYALRRRR